MLLDCWTIDFLWCTTICLPDGVFSEMKRINKQRRVVHHHVNKSAHTSHETINFLNTIQNWIYGSSAIVSDSALNDFFIFLIRKNKMRGTWFLLAEETVDPFKKHVFEVSQADWEKCYDDLFKFMKVNIFSIKKAIF